MLSKNQKGFTLIELMIVIAIIGILASIAIPAYAQYIARSQMSEAMTLANSLKSNVSEVFSDDGTCPNNSAAAVDGISAAADIKGKYVATVTTGGTAAATGGCTVTAALASKGVAKAIQSKQVRLTLSNADSGSFVWACSSDAAEKYLPTSCHSGGTL